MVLYHDLVGGGASWKLLATTTGCMSLKIRTQNTFNGNNKIKLARVQNYVQGQAFGLENCIEFDTGMIADGMVDDTQIIVPSGYAFVVMADNEVAIRVHGYAIDDRHCVFWPSVIPAVGAYKRLGVAAQNCQVVARLVNLDAVPVNAFMYIAAAGYVDGTEPPRGRSYGRNVTIPPAGSVDGGVYEESDIPLDAGESIVVISGGRLACHVCGINR